MKTEGMQTVEVEIPIFTGRLVCQHDDFSLEKNCATHEKIACPHQNHVTHEKVAFPHQNHKNSFFKCAFVCKKQDKIV